MRTLNTKPDQAGAIAPVKTQSKQPDISFEELKKWIEDTNFFKK